VGRAWVRDLLGTRCTLRLQWDDGTRIELELGAPGPLTRVGNTIKAALAQMSRSSWAPTHCLAQGLVLPIGNRRPRRYTHVQFVLALDRLRKSTATWMNRDWLAMLAELRADHGPVIWRYTWLCSVIRTCLYAAFQGTNQNWAVHSASTGTGPLSWTSEARFESLPQVFMPPIGTRGPGRRTHV
jgi:hypothetical protein